MPHENKFHDPEIPTQGPHPEKNIYSHQNTADPISDAVKLEIEKKVEEQRVRSLNLINSHFDRVKIDVQNFLRVKLIPVGGTAFRVEIAWDSQNPPLK
jgi:hypothetical protein